MTFLTRTKSMDGIVVDRFAQQTKTPDLHPTMAGIMLLTASEPTVPITLTRDTYLDAFSIAFPSYLITPCL